MCAPKMKLLLSLILVTHVATFTLAQGVGILANGNSAENNSAVVGNRYNQIGTLYCMTVATSINTARWLAPDGTEITNNTGSYVIVSGGGSPYSYIGLQLKGGYSLTAAEEGVYTCIILDENGVEQILYVGIYRLGPYAFPSVTVSSSTYPLFTLNCTTTGTPANIEWLDISSGLVYENDDTHFIEQVLRNGVTATYDSILAFASSPVHGVHRCTTSTKYVSSNSSETNSTIASGGKHFGLYNVGQSMSVFCNTGDDTVLAQWIDDSGMVVADSTFSPTVTLNINPLTDDHHNHLYICRKFSASAIRNTEFRIIIIMPQQPIVMDINPSTTEVPIAGSYYSLSCIVVDNIVGLSSLPDVEWHDSEGNRIESGGGITVSDQIRTPLSVTITISFVNIHTSHAGQYTCHTTLSSPALTFPYVDMETKDVNTSVPAPVVSIEVSSGPFYTGDSLSLGCGITLPPVVDSGVTVSANWTGPNGILYNSSYVTVVGPTMISSHVYYSNITISSSQLVDTGTYTCSAIVAGLSTYIIGSMGSDVRTITIEARPLVVEIQPSSVTILDVAPYNNFTLTCTATVSNTKMLFKWTRGDTILTHDGDSIIISSSDFSSATSTSTLTTSETTSGTVTYSCFASISMESNGSDSTDVVVKGPIPPAQPTRLQIAGITHTTATLEWTISYIAYTPENYKVKYGTSETALDNTGDIVTGSTYLTTTHEVFSNQLTGLIHDTTYYYKVQATNSHMTTDSEVSTFETHPLPLIVLIHISGTMTAGSELALTCIAEESENITGTPQISWIGPNGTQITASGLTLDNAVTNGATTTSILHFSPLSVEHAGEYTCVAYVGSIHQQKSDSYTITVETLMLEVEIGSSPTGPKYQAASSGSLICEITGNFFGTATYQWSSTCTGDCFVLGRNTPTVSTGAFRSIDSGAHTCTAVDAVGNSGTATIQMNVVGIGINVENTGILPNNSFITANVSGMIGHLDCSSGSMTSNVGRWVAPNGEDITYSSIDPFDVTVGSANDPGHLSIQQASGHFLTASFQGVYTCTIPDENGVERSLHVGLYLNGFNTSISITSLEKAEDINSPFTLECVSTGSPATSVTWSKDGMQLTSDGTYTMTQILHSGRIATYKTLLEVNTRPYDIHGKYSCGVSNILGTDSETITIRGIQTNTSTVPFIVGDMASITCSSDLDVSSVEWLYHGGVVLSSTNQQELKLVFNPVNDIIHNRQYTCQVTSPYGIQETTVPIVAEISPDHVTVSITTEGNPIVGQQYTLICTVTYAEGLTNPVAVEWRDAYGPVTTDEDITVGDPVASGATVTQTLEFDPVSKYHTIHFVCQASVTSPAPPFVLIELAEVDTVIGAPPSPPLNFTIAFEGPETLSFSWSPPADGEGNYIEYTLSCLPESTNLPQAFTSAGNYILDGFVPATVYTCSIYASTTEGGIGPSVTKVATPHSSLFQLRLTAVPDCDDWVYKYTDEKVADIIDAVVTGVRECAITKQHITDALFRCPNEPEDVIFQARIYDTAKNSTKVISCIEEWVEKAPTINILRIGISLDPSCTVEIHSFDEDVCPRQTSDEVGQSSNGSNQQIIITVVGCLLGGIGLIIALISLAVYIFRRRFRNKNRGSHDPNLNFTSSQRLSQASDTYVPMGAIGTSEYAYPGDVHLPPKFYSKSVTAFQPPGAPSAMSATMNPYEVGQGGGFPQYRSRISSESQQSSGGEYIKMDRSLDNVKTYESDDSIYERIPGEDDTQ